MVMKNDPLFTSKKFGMTKNTANECITSLAQKKIAVREESTCLDELFSFWCFPPENTLKNHQNPKGVNIMVVRYGGDNSSAEHMMKVGIIIAMHIDSPNETQ